MRDRTAPYRISAGPENRVRVRLRDLPDRDVLVALAVVWPAFLAVVVHALRVGEAFGAGTTIAAAIVVGTPLAFASALRAR